MSVPLRARLPGVEPVTVWADDLPVAALAAGDPDAPPVVLVPGFTGSKEDFLPVLLPLAAAGLRAVAIDQRGQYQTPGRPDGDYSLTGFGADLSAVLDTWQRPVHLVGHSFGGVVCTQTTLARPRQVASLVLLDSGPGPVPARHHPLLTTLLGLAQVATAEQIWAAKAEIDRQAGVPPLPPEVEDFLHERWVATDVRSLAAIADLLLTVPDRTGDLAAVLDPVHRPGLVMYGEWDDSAWDVPDLAAMADRLGVPAVAVPGAAHSPAVENPEFTAAQLVGFVTSADV